MTSPRDDFAVLLEAPDPIEADLARELLASHGIPSMLHGVDRDIAELGSAIHSSVARPDLLVPHSALAAARLILAETWDASALTDELAEGEPPDDAVPPRAVGGRTAVIIIAALLAALVSVTCVIEYVVPSLRGES